MRNIPIIVLHRRPNGNQQLVWRVRSFRNQDIHLGFEFIRVVYQGASTIEMWQEDNVFHIRDREDPHYNIPNEAQLRQIMQRLVPPPRQINDMERAIRSAIRNLKVTVVFVIAIAAAFFFISILDELL